MPTHVKPQLTESATPMLEIWDQLERELLPNARSILTVIRYYAERDLPIPDADTELSGEEREGLNPVVRALMDAAIASEEMRESVLAATLKKLPRILPCSFSASCRPLSNGKLPDTIRGVTKSPERIAWTFGVASKAPAVTPWKLLGKPKLQKPRKLPSG